MSKPMLTLKLPKSELSMPLGKAVLNLWYIASYPLELALAYYLLGWIGVGLVVGRQIATFRGNL